MNATFKKDIIKKIGKADDVTLLEINELLNFQTENSNSENIPLYVKPRLLKSKQQAKEGKYISHEYIMKRYK